MLSFLSGITFFSNVYKQRKGHIFFLSSLQLMKTNAKIIPTLKWDPFFKKEIGDIETVTEKKTKSLYDTHSDIYVPLTNSFLYDKRYNTHDSGKTVNDGITQNNGSHYYQTFFMRNEYDNCPKYAALKKATQVLSFSWLKTIRKKQYYNIIGKIGIKKRNAGMYWKFYVAKRKKIRKKKRTI